MRWRKWLLQASVSCAVLGALFWILPADEIVDGIWQVPPMLFATVLLFFLSGHVVAAAKWWVLIGRGAPFLAVARAHFVGLTANLCLPGVAGGDAARVAMIWTRTPDRAALAAGSVSDRLIDMIGLGALALLGLVFAGGDGAQSDLAFRALGVAVVVFGLGLWAAPRLLPRVWVAIPRLPARDFVERSSAAMVDLGRRPGLLGGVLLLSMAVQGTFIVLSLQLARAAGVDVPLAAWAFAWALAKLVVILPVSLGGLGVREAIMAALLSQFGASAAHVLAGGLAWQAVLFLSGGVGALLLIKSGARLRLRPEPEDTLQETGSHR